MISNLEVISDIATEIVLSLIDSILFPGFSVLLDVVNVTWTDVILLEYAASLVSPVPHLLSRTV
jgi:hypothetical protein